MAVCSLAADHTHTNTGLSTDLEVATVAVVIVEIIHTHIHCALVELGRHAAQSTVKTFTFINIYIKKEMSELFL